MRRNLDLIRDILLALEAENEPRPFRALHIDGVDDMVISYHVELMAEAGWITADDESTADGHAWHPVRLTLRGHQVLDVLRPVTWWARARERLAALGGEVGLDALKAVAFEVATKAIGISSIK